MKKYIILAILLCIPISVGAWGLLNQMGGAESGGGGASCSGYYGNDTAQSDFDYSNTSGHIVIFRISLSCGGAVASVRFHTSYFSDSAWEGEFALYADNGSGTDPGDLLGNYGAFSDEANSSEEGSYLTDSTVSETISGEPSYVWLAIMQENSEYHYYHYSATTGGVGRLYDGTWDSWPSSWPTGSDSAVTYNYRAEINF